MLPIMLVAGALFGMVWAAIPAYLQAYRGSHIVITTIMFNFLASSLLVYLLVNHFKVPGSMAVETAAFAPSAKLPSMTDFMALFGIEWAANSPLNTSLFLALLACLRRGLPAAVAYPRRVRPACHRLQRQCGGLCRHQPQAPGDGGDGVSGALAGMVGMNEIAGVTGRLMLEYVSGAGFTGIAVALMGRTIRSASCWPACCSAPCSRAAPRSVSRSRASAATWW
jgi:ABC-type uncharacterized transport system permease subunit